MFLFLDDVKQEIWNWRQECNQLRPHSSLNGRTA
ncbi:MAG: transposase [Melioribacteraceae bacterium]|nr:transposase [Melioribacteraceae bacterium]